MPVPGRKGAIIAGFFTLCLADTSKTVRIMRKGKMDQEALRYHSEGRPGKIAVVPTKPYHTQHDLSLAYSPGVAAPCREIEANPEEVYRYTNKGNLVAVISNGTAVLGLGNIGALAGKPVMEGKSMLFKTYADIDAFDIEVDETDPEAFIRTVKAIAPTFGGINLEDIKAPECFEIDRRLSEELDIPVMHDDQHGTAVISTAAMLNAVKIAGKTLDKLRVVVNGAGAAAIACARLFIAVGVRRENMVFCDSRGVVTTYRTDINEIKRLIKTQPQKLSLNEMYLAAQDMKLGSEEYNETFEVAVRMFPDDEVANLNAANAAMDRGDMKNAEYYLKKAGNSPQAVYGRGTYAALKKEFDMAEKMFTEAAHRGLADAEEMLKQIEEIKH